MGMFSWIAAFGSLRMFFAAGNYRLVTMYRRIQRPLPIDSPLSSIDNIYGPESSKKRGNLIAAKRIARFAVSVQVLDSFVAERLTVVSASDHSGFGDAGRASR
jgi:hypothetical protein